MGRHVAESVTEWEAALREWSVLDRRFDERTSNPHAGTTRANRLAKRLGALGQELVGEPLFQSLVHELLEDPDPRVRCHAAMDALAWDPALAERVLIELEAGEGMASMSAHYILLRHRASAAPVTPQTDPSSPPPLTSEFTSEMEALSDDVWAFHGATMNGGFLLAFASAGHIADRALRAFDAIGMPEVAELIGSAIALFPRGEIPDDPEDRNHLVDHVIDASRLESLGDRYTTLIGSDDQLATRLERLAPP